MRSAKERSRRTYVVLRSGWYEPGTPCVVAECAGPGIAEGACLPGAQILTRRDMEREPSLQSALRAWKGGDDEVWEGECETQERILAGALSVNTRVAAAVEAILRGHAPSPGSEPGRLRHAPGWDELVAGDPEPTDIRTRRRAG